MFKIYRRLNLNLFKKQFKMTSAIDTPPTTPIHELTLSSSVNKSKTNKIDFNDTTSVRSFALLHCQEYLGGIWRTLKNSQFQIDKIS